MEKNADELLYGQRIVPLSEYYQLFALRLRVKKPFLKLILKLLQQEGAIEVNYHSPKGAHIRVKL